MRAVARNAKIARFGKALATALPLALIVALVAAPSPAQAQRKPSAASSPSGGGGSKAALSTEALGAKAFLEDLMTKRLSAELATKVDRQSFSLGSQLELVAVPPPPTPVAPTAQKAPWETEPMSDLMLGALDPEELLKSFAAGNSPNEEKPAIRKILESFKIKSVTVSVGLRDELGPEVKTEVDAWLKKRIATEFGSAGKASVDLIKMPLKKKEIVMEKTPWQWLEQFQGLAGQIVLALGIFFAVVVWQLMSRGGAAVADALGAGGGMGGYDDSTNEIEQIAAAYDEKNKEDGLVAAADELDQANAGYDMGSLKARIIEIIPKLQTHLEEVISSWCRMGDNGRLRLACFAEAVGSEIGKLPIPVDALSDVQKIFSKMPEFALKEKRTALEKAYWDMLSAINLGSDSIEQPFSYLGTANMSLLNQVLMHQNPKLRAVVSLYMPSDMRARYVKSLNDEEKKELLTSAAGLSEIRMDELYAFDRTLLGKLTRTSTGEVIPLDMSLAKLATSLSPSEEIKILAEMRGGAIEEYKRTIPSLAFLADWPDEQLRFLLTGVRPDEIVALLRVRADLKERVLSLCSPMTLEIANEELAAPDHMSPAEKDEALIALKERLADLVTQKEISLEDVFPNTPGLSTASTGTSDDEDPNGTKRVA